MTGRLTPNTTIGTMLGGRVRVLSYIGGGGQGDVYRVDYNGEDKALKWYRIDKIRNVSKFVANLKRNVLNGRPTDDFLWPIDITDVYDGTFGYVMDLRPDGFVVAKEFLLGNVRFPSMRRKVDACLNIVSAFRILHDNAYSYQDVNAANFFIEPATGRVLICDNDNVALNGSSMGVLGTLNYMAPEIVTRSSLPNKYSDRHSLAVLLFRLLFGSHPLEGSRSSNTVLNESTKLSIFGTNALFVFDSSNHANTPYPYMRHGLEALWNQMPSHVRRMFEETFSQHSLRNPQSRPVETAWLPVLARLRSEIVPCACGNEVCCEDGAPTVCERCGRTVRTAYVADVRRCTLPVSVDMRLYRCQLGHPRPSDALRLEAWVIGALNDDRLMGMRNMGNQTWSCASGRGERFSLRPNEVRQIESGLVCNIPMLGASTKVVVRRNNL